MKRKLGWLAALVAILGVPSSLLAQTNIGIGIAPHIGTLGVGADVAVSPHPRVALRVGGNFFPFDLDACTGGGDFTLGTCATGAASTDIDIKVELPSPQFTALIDLFLVSQLRLSGGLLLSQSVDLAGNFANSVTIGNNTYTPAEIGTFTGEISNGNAAPYLGIGWGNIARSSVGFFIDLGVGFRQETEVLLSAEDGTLSSAPQFQADLATETQEFQDDIQALSWDPFQLFPVVSLGLSFGFQLP